MTMRRLCGRATVPGLMVAVGAMGLGLASALVGPPRDALGVALILAPWAVMMAGAFLAVTSKGDR